MHSWKLPSIQFYIQYLHRRKRCNRKQNPKRAPGLLALYAHQPHENYHQSKLYSNPQNKLVVTAWKDKAVYKRGIKSKHLFLFVEVKEQNLKQQALVPLGEGYEQSSTQRLSLNADSSTAPSITEAERQNALLAQYGSDWNIREFTLSVIKHGQVSITHTLIIMQ